MALLGRSALLLVGLFVIGSLLSSCARTPREPSRIVRVVVLDAMVDFEAPQRGAVQEEGWWFGFRDRYRGSNMGVGMGDALAREVGRIPGVDVFPREDLSIYMGRKERILSNNFPELGSEDRKRLLLEQDPVNYGRSLNVDFVITSSVADASTVLNRTVKWWYSHVDTLIEVWDVSSEQVVFAYPVSRTRYFNSQYRVSQSIGKSLARQLQRGDVLRVH